MHNPLDVDRMPFTGFAPPGRSSRPARRRTCRATTPAPSPPGQVEGASIDKQDRATDARGQFGGTVAFDAAVGVALDHRRHLPDTMVVVTADHSHTSQIVSEDAPPARAGTPG